MPNSAYLYMKLIWSLQVGVLGVFIATAMLGSGPRYNAHLTSAPVLASKKIRVRPTVCPLREGCSVALSY